MFKHVKPTGSKEKNQTILTNGISAPIKYSNTEKLQQFKKFNMTNANIGVLDKYDPEQLFRAGDPNSQPIEQDKEFEKGQEILKKMGYTQIFQIKK